MKFRSNWQIFQPLLHDLSHTLINITENIRKAFGDGNIGCGVFVDL